MLSNQSLTAEKMTGDSEEALLPWKYPVIGMVWKRKKQGDAKEHWHIDKISL